MGEVGRKVELLLYWTISQIIFVAFGVLGMIATNYLKGGLYRYEKAVSYYEVLWTALPTVILCSVAGPSMCLLYFHEQEGDALLNIKCIGHQWYWRYDYADLEEIRLDRFMVPTEDLNGGERRLLETDARLVLPLNTKTQFYITREDVIHSWALPIEGVKIDATPGRLNSISVNLTAPGLFYGQCRELCGANHSLIPIVVEVTSPSLLVEWIKLVYDDKILDNFLQPCLYWNHIHCYRGLGRWSGRRPFPAYAKRDQL